MQLNPRRTLMTPSTKLSVLSVILGLSLVGAGQEKYAPYKERAVTKSDVDNTLAQAQTQGKFLMVEFGANWSNDCMNQAKKLDEKEMKTYFQQRFVLLTVDVGRFDRNKEIAKSLGVELNVIPTAVFFPPDSRGAGLTNKMELQPARKYGTAEIL